MLGEAQCLVVVMGGCVERVGNDPVSDVELREA